MFSAPHGAAACNALRAIVFASIAIWTAACEEEPLPSEVGVADLLAAPSRFDGRIVTVTGVAVIEFEGTSLYPSMARAEETVDSGVWLDLDYKAYAEFDRKPVTVEGKFVSGPGGHFGIFPGEISPVQGISLIVGDDGGSREE